MPEVTNYHFDDWGHVVITSYPELFDELPDLLSELGTVTEIIPEYFAHVAVRIALHKPAKVVNWRNDWGKGMAINSDTRACFTGKISTRVNRLPKNGDTEVIVHFDLSLDSRDNGPHTIDIVRDAIRGFASAASIDWYYHF